MERYRRALLSSSSSFLLLGASVLSNLIVVPMALSYLGKERYGIWLTLSSFLSWLTLAQFGTPWGLQNALAAANAHNDRREARKLLSSAFYAVSAFALLLLAASAVSLWFANLPRVFNTSQSIGAPELQIVVGIALALVILMVPVNSLMTVYNAYQMGYVLQMWELARVAVNLTMLFVIQFTSLKLIGWVVAFYVTGLAIGVVNLGWLFSSRFRWLRPSLAEFSFGSLRRIAKTSLAALACSIGILVLNSSSNIVITRFLGPSEVPEFALPAMIFVLGRSMAGSVMSNLSAAYTEAAARGDWGWVQRAHKRSRVFAASVSTSVAMGMIVLGPWLLNLWTRHQVHGDRLLIGIMGVHTVLWITLGGDNILITSLDRAHVLPPMIFAEAVIFLCLAGYLTPHYRQTGVAIAGLVGFVLTNAWYYPFQAYRTKVFGSRRYLAE